MNVAVLLAGGSGRRMGGAEPKQFIHIAGRTILEHSIRAFALHPAIDRILIVSHADFIERVRDIAAPYAKVQEILRGGRERYESTLAAIAALQPGPGQSAPEPDIRLLIHDAVRPLVSARIITDCIEALSHHRAVDVAIPCTDTIVEVDASGHIARIPSRDMLRHVQTPQGFHLGIIARAYELGLRDPSFITTDDCGVVHRYLPDEPIWVVQGETSNIKLTYPEDLLLAESILSAR